MTCDLSFKILMGLFVSWSLLSCATNSGRPQAVSDPEGKIERSAKRQNTAGEELVKRNQGPVEPETTANEVGAVSGSSVIAENPPTEADKKSHQLNEAIRTQSDQEIFNASSQILFDSPNNLKALNAMALFNYKKGKFLAAEYLLRKAIADHPNSSEVHSNLGIVYLGEKKDREAILEFRKALEINSDDVVASANLGSIYVIQKDYTKAQIVLETVYRKGWKDAKTLANYAIALAAGGKFDKSEEIYKTLIKEQNSNKEVLFNYAILQVEHLNKFAEGLETINRLKFIGPPGDFRKRLAALEAKAKAGK